tara:strand:+ start:131 stop:832 length:702 start_codon:yes stop_codon:yes gene_type:complete
MSKYSIIIPTFNEKKNIFILIKRIKKFLKKNNYEIIVVDDDSYDGSITVFNKIKKKERKFSFYIRRDKKRDLSKSIILGIKKSKFNNLIIMDGDLQHNPKYLPILIKNFNTKKQDILVAVRNFKKRSGLSILRFFLSLSLITLINLIFKKKTNDPMSGFFIVKKTVFIRSKKQLYGKGFKILFDIIYSSKKNIIVNDYSIKFDSRKNNKSKMSLKILFHIILLIIQKMINKLI